MKKILVLILTLVSIVDRTNAQQLETPSHDSMYWHREGERVIRDAPFVFKGRILRQGAARVNKTEAWVVEQILVTEVFKGNLAVGDTVEYQNNTGCSFRADRSMDCPMHNPSPPIVSRGDAVQQYFFFKPSALPRYLKGSSRVFQFFNEDAPYTAYPDVEPDGRIGRQIFRFYEVYDNEIAFRNVIFQLIKKQKNSKSSLSNTKVPVRVFNKKGKRVGMRMALPTNIALSTANEQTTVSNGVRYLEFDILARSNRAVYIGFINISMKYNPSLFSTVFNKCFVTLGPNIDPTRYHSSISTYGATVDSLGLGIGEVSSTTGNLFSLTTTDQVILHHKIAITACGSTSGYKFKIATGQYHEIGGNPNSYANVNQFTFTQPLFRIPITNLQLCPVCPPNPDSIVFTPKTTRAGTGEAITLKPYYNGAPCSNYFGALKGNIQFRDADLAESNTTPLYAKTIDSIDIVTWADDSIKVIVPSRYFQDTTMKKGCAGSGLVKVIKKDISNTTVITNKKLHIEYAAANYPTYTNGALTKKRSLFVNKDCRRQYPLRCHTSVTSLAMRRSIWEAAKAWNRKLGYEILQIDSVNLVSYLTHPYECIIKVEAVTAPAGCTNCSVIMETSPKNYSSTSFTVPFSEKLYTTGFDIRINPTYVNNGYFQVDYPLLQPDSSYSYNSTAACNLTKKDFYQSISHEIGHGLNLGHCIDENHNDATPSTDTELMYWSAQAAGTTAANRRTLTTGGGHSLKGVKEILALSKQTVWANTDITTFGKSIDTVGIRFALAPSNTTICGLNKWTSINTNFTRNGAALAGGSYAWQTKSSPTSTFVEFADVPNQMVGQGTPNLLVKYTNTFNPDYYKIKSLASYNSCPIGAIPEQEIRTFMSIDQTVLKPVAIRCKPTQTTNPVILSPTPVALQAGGTFTLLNTKTNVIGGIVTTSPFALADTLPAGKYEIIYKFNAGTCGTGEDRKPFHYISNCYTVAPKINALYQAPSYKSVYTFCADRNFRLQYTIMGTIATCTSSVCDSVKVQVSSATGVFSTNTLSNILGRKKLATGGQVTDSINCFIRTNIGDAAGTATTFRVRLIYRNAAGAELMDTLYSGIAIKQNPTTQSCLPAGTTIGGGKRLANNGSNNEADNETENIPENIQFAIYPNPAQNSVTVKTTTYDDATQIHILDLNGRILYSIMVNNDVTEINTTDLPAGIYLVRLSTNNKQTIRKLVIQK